ncbi:MAG: hypothetical protein IJP92_10400 [Lachnospiraceae bacterium]|nr:hypothetical protein [Lachnospiraceae bacterium]
MFKRLIMTVVMAMIMVGTFNSKVQAAAPSTMEAETCNVNSIPTVRPRWDETTFFNTDISADGRTVTSSVYAYVSNPSISVSGTLYLEKYDRGTWKTVKSWSYTGSFQINVIKRYTVSSGGSYRTRAYMVAGSDRINQASGSIYIY